MNLDECWIGDLLWIKSKGVNGTFEGSQNGKARIRIGQLFILISPTDLEPAREDREDDEEDLEDIDQVGSLPKSKQKFQPEIDLHLEKIPGYAPNQWNNALDFQIATCRKFLEEAINRRTVSVLIIHGKGAGILKEQVRHLLGDFKEVFQTFPINNGGAMEVWFNYRSE